MTHKDWIIRRANLKDITALEQCIAVPSNTKKTYNFHEKIMDNPVWIAEYNNEIIGGIALRLTKEAIHIDYVGIAEHYKEKGVDRYLIQFAENEASKRHCSLVVVTLDENNKVDLPLYEHLGWTVNYSKKKVVTVQKNIVEATE